MSEHHATIRWQRRSSSFAYDAYSRDHTWAFPGGAEVAASAAPNYLGDAALVDPEEALVASLSSCHMLTFLAIAARRGLVVDEYTDDAVGFLEKNEERRLAVTRVILRPRITFGDGSAPSQEDLDDLHHVAHEQCFIANSVKTRITVEPR
jgi:organic hydroperoxide reductase OsmC/OhrA